MFPDFRVLINVRTRPNVTFSRVPVASSPAPVGESVLGISSPVGVDLAANVIVYVGDDGRLYPAFADNLAHMFRISGILTVAALTNQTSILRTDGIIVNPTWNFTVNQPVFLGLNGSIVQIIEPTAKFLISVGTVMTPNSIAVDIGQPLLLE